VWLARRPDLARPAPEPTLASASKASSSEGGKGIQGLNEQYEPTDSNDHTAIYFSLVAEEGLHRVGAVRVPRRDDVSETSVYWFDDTGQGECRVPRSWRVLYKSGAQWLPVATRDAFGVAKAPTTPSASRRSGPVRFVSKLFCPPTSRRHSGVEGQVGMNRVQLEICCGSLDDAVEAGPAAPTAWSCARRCSWAA